MCRTTFMPSGIRLQQLIQNRYKEILAREKNNDKFIHLYDIGAYWVAFERSACRLSGLFSKSELTLFRVPDCVEYVVMVSVPADEAEGCLVHHFARWNLPESVVGACFADGGLSSLA